MINISHRVVEVILLRLYGNYVMKILKSKDERMEALDTMKVIRIVAQYSN